MFSEKMDPEGVNSTYTTTQCSTVETWELCLVAERSRVCAEMQLAIVTLHRTWKECSSWFQRTVINPMMDVPSFTRRDATPCYYFSFVSIHGWWLIRAVRLLQIVIVSYPPMGPHSFSLAWIVYHLESACPELPLWPLTPEKVTHMHAHCFGLRVKDQRNVKVKSKTVCLLCLIWWQRQCCTLFTIGMTS